MSLDRCPRVRDEENWLEQRIEVRALVDDHLAAAGTPVALDSRRLGTVFRLSGGVLRVRNPLSDGQRYRVWSYAPDPSPAVLASSKPRYPTAARRCSSSTVDCFPEFPPGRGARAGAPPARDCDSSRTYLPLHSVLRRLCAALPGRASDRRVSRQSLRSGARARVVVQAARRLPLRRAAAGRRPARRSSQFVTQTKAGYCQHYAGAMAVMLRMLGIPARVAVGFTSGTARRREMDRHRPRCPCLGRGLVRGPGLGSVRPDAWARHVRRDLLVRLGLGGRPSRHSVGAT